MDDYQGFEIIGNNENIFSKSKNSTKLIGNLELFNLEELNQKYNLNFSNQIDFLFNFLEKFGIEKIDELKGFYSFAYQKNSKTYLFRDVVGVKTLCYSHNLKENNTNTQNFQFSSNFKYLSKSAIELNPRTYIIYNNKTNTLEIKERDKYYDVKEVINGNYNEIRKEVKELFLKSIKKQIYDKNKKIGILFSGGTDSTLMALCLQELKIPFKCYTASIIGGNLTEGEDVIYARKIAKLCKFNWELAEININEVAIETKNIIPIINSTNYVKVSVALPLFVALKKAKKDEVKYMFTGIGSEEVFADYKRDCENEMSEVNEICIEGLKSLWKRDLYRDYTLANYNNINLKFPFLEDNFVEYSIRINSKFKLNKETKVNKIILRDILRDFNLREDLVARKKKAAQYGCKSDRAFEKLAFKKRIPKQEYLNSL